MSTSRIALGLEYDGAGYCGWERQRHCKAVQAVLETALSEIADHSVTTVCAGRTDSGVHALAQVVHFDTTAIRPLHAWVLGTNGRAPRDISVEWARPVDLGFSARFSATLRRYSYFVLNRRSRPALLHRRATWERRPLDVTVMRQAAAHLVGEHDFSAYRAAGCQARTPVRRVESMTVTRSGELVRIDISANAFLHHMVRNVVGVLLAVGAGERAAEWAREVLQSRDRRCAGITAASDGLYLVGVRYPSAYELPSDPLGTKGHAEVCPLPGLWYPA